MAETQKRPNFNPKERIFSPPGLILYPFIDKPRDYKNDGKFKYSFDLVLEGAAATEFEKTVDGYLEEAWVLRGKPLDSKGNPKKADPPYSYVLDDDGKPTGKIKFKFKITAYVERRDGGGTWDRKPVIVDSNNEPIVPRPALGNGARVTACYFRDAWANASGAGVSLRPVGLRVLELVEYVRKAENPFASTDAVEGGYVQPEPEEDEGGDESPEGTPEVPEGADY